jgi:hypothetical protein
MTSFQDPTEELMAEKKGLPERDRKKVNEQLKQLRDMIKVLQDAGVEVPSSLTKALKGLQVALDTGEDLGTAFEEASSAVASLEKDLLAACKNVDEAVQMVCEAKVTRVWQARSVKFTLDYKNPDSVTAKFIQKTVQRYTPSKICQYWAYCKKEVAK